MPAAEVTVPRQPAWLVGLMMALIGFAVWTLFSLWPWLMNSHAPFRIREACQSPLVRRSGRQVGRTCGTQNAFEQLIRILTDIWLTKSDSGSQAL